MPSSSSAPRKRRLLPVVLLSLLGIFATLSVTASVLASHPSAAYARNASGRFDRFAGDGSAQFAFHAGYTKSNTNSSRGLSTPDAAGFPLQLSSLSILDASGTDLSSTVAYRLMEQARGIDRLNHVDVRIPGSPLELDRIGELILVVEELESKPGHWFGAWSATYRVFLGHKPPFGWLDSKETVSPLNADWDITTEVTFYGSPLQRLDAVAGVIADAVDLGSTFEQILEDFTAAPPVPTEALPNAAEFGASKEVAIATGLGEAPLLSGLRLGRKGEAIWRYVGADVCDRIDAAKGELLKDGWTVFDKGSRGADGKTHRIALQRGHEFAEWVYQENRESVLQQESWTSHSLPDGTWSEQVHHVTGPPLPPALWLHYWHDQSKSELATSLDAAGPSRPAALANLPSHQRQLLEIPPVQTDPTRVRKGK